MTIQDFFFALSVDNFASDSCIMLPFELISRHFFSTPIEGKHLVKHFSNGISFRKMEYKISPTIICVSNDESTEWFAKFCPLATLNIPFVLFCSFSVSFGMHTPYMDRIFVLFFDRHILFRMTK